MYGIHPDDSISNNEFKPGREKRGNEDEQSIVAALCRLKYFVQISITSSAKLGHKRFGC